MDDFHIRRNNKNVEKIPNLLLQRQYDIIINLSNMIFIINDHFKRNAMKLSRQ